MKNHRTFDLCWFYRKVKFSFWILSALLFLYCGRCVNIFQTKWHSCVHVFDMDVPWVLYCVYDFPKPQMLQWFLKNKMVKFITNSSITLKNSNSMAFKFVSIIKVIIAFCNSSSFINKVGLDPTTLFFEKIVHLDFLELITTTDGIVSSNHLTLFRV